MKQQEEKVKVAKMIMLRLMNCHTRKDKVWNDCKREDIDMSDNYQGKYNRKLVDVLWTCAKKTTGDISEESSKLYVFLSL